MTCSPQVSICYSLEEIQLIALAWLAVAGPGELGHLQRTQTKRRRQLLLHLAKSHISRSNYPTAPLCVVVKSVLTRRVFLKGLSPSAIKLGEPQSRIFANAGSIKRTKLKVCSCTAPELTVGLQIGNLPITLRSSCSLPCHFLDSFSMWLLKLGCIFSGFKGWKRPFDPLVMCILWP